jgi:hypothetical protein
MYPGLSGSPNGAGRSPQPHSLVPPARNHQIWLNLQRIHKNLHLGGNKKKPEGYGDKLHTFNKKNVQFLGNTKKHMEGYGDKLHTFNLIYYLLLTTDYWPFTTYYWLLTIYYLLLTTVMPECIRVCQNVYEYVRMYTSMPGCIRVCRNVSLYI